MPKLSPLTAFQLMPVEVRLLKWLRAFKKFPGTVFLNHGEPNATGALAQQLKQEFGAKVIVAKTGESYLLG